MSNPDKAENQTDPINREAERDRIQGSDVTADPLSGGGQGSATGQTGQSTADHKIRASQDEPAGDIAAQRRDVVGFTNDVQRPPTTSGMGAKGEEERLGGDAGGEFDPLSDNERRTTGQADERSAQPADGAFGSGGEEYGNSTNSGDKAAPYNQVPSMDPGTGGE